MDVVLCVQKVNELIHMLPEVNQAVLGELMRLLHQIDLSVEVSKVAYARLSTPLPFSKSNFRWTQGHYQL